MDLTDMYANFTVGYIKTVSFYVQCISQYKH